MDTSFSSFCGGFGAHVLKGRWFMVFATMMVMSASGLAYIFGLYSPELKKTLGYDQTTLNLLSFFKDVGTMVGVPSGLLMEITPPWVVLACGAILNFFGYFMIWLGVTRRIAKPAVWHMCLYICIGANSQAFANTGALVTCVKNFPESRGVVIGLLKGYMGLSGAIYTQIYHAIYKDDTVNLILLIGWLPAVIAVIFILTIRYMKPVPQTNEAKIFYRILYTSLILAGFLMVMIIIQKQFPFNHGEYIGSGVTVLLLLSLPIAVILAEDYRTWKLRKIIADNATAVSTSQQHKTVDVIEPPNPAKQQQQKLADIRWYEKVFKPPALGEDYTILQAFFSIDMLILFIATICGVGGTLTTIDNLGQIGASLSYPKRSISTFVSLVSIWNYLGRVASGFGSEYILEKYKIPRPLVLTFVLLFTTIGHLLVAFGVHNGLYFASVIIGFCYGAQWPLLFAIISELFGLKYYSTLFNFGTLASPIGVYVLNVKVTGYLYDREAEKQLAALGQVRKAGEELSCQGVECFKLAFLIIAGVTVVGMLVSFLLVVRTRAFYKSDIYGKFRVEEEVMVVKGGNGDDIGLSLTEETNHKKH